jgi:hypothetical protein
VTEDELERDFLAIFRSLDPANRERVERILAGVLAGRVTLTAGEIEALRAGEVAALADALPADRLEDWPRLVEPH